jgi:hypothetical protein
MIRRLVDAIGNISFSRGLAIGAMVGAAIAGSTIWSRIRGGHDRSAAEPVEHSE